MNPVEAQKMADVAKSSGKLLMTMRNNRFSEEAQFAKQMIGQGELGELYTLKAFFIAHDLVPPILYFRCVAVYKNLTSVEVRSEAASLKNGLESADSRPFFCQLLRSREGVGGGIN
ncbi:hypothetical protein [Cohnella sp. 56]|uniref:hypothetical protein n=1 Tax=Cohnella sp. 56 TaxID=3113722 RepID=UPI0030EAD2C2